MLVINISYSRFTNSAEGLFILQGIRERMGLNDSSRQSRLSELNGPGEFSRWADQADEWIGLDEQGKHVRWVGMN